MIQSRSAVAAVSLNPADASAHSSCAPIAFAHKARVKKGRKMKVLLTFRKQPAFNVSPSRPEEKNESWHRLRFKGEQSRQEETNERRRLRATGLRADKPTSPRLHTHEARLVPTGSTAR